MKYKQCTTCNKEKQLEEFTFHLMTKDRLQNKCKSCRKNSNKIYYDKRRKEYLESIKGTIS